MPLPVLFLIPARGGSRRIPAKNLQTVAGIPLVARAIRIAHRAAATIPDGPHAVVVSTDDPSIAELAREWHAEVPFPRPADLATDDARSVDVVLHALESLRAAGRRFRCVVLVQPTSPLTDPADIAAAVGLLDGGGVRAAVSVVRSHPATWHVRPADGPTAPLTSVTERGDLLLTGAFYAIDPDLLAAQHGFLPPGATVGVEVAAERSIDIDQPIDLVIAESLARAMPVPDLRIGDRTIGDGRPALVIAEAGVNHDGDLDVAHRLVDAAADSGADAVKFQTFDPEALAAAGAPLAQYQAHGTAATDQRAMLARLALPSDSWAALQRHALDRGILFLSSPFDAAAADLLEGLDVPALKVASGELTNHPLLAHLAAKRRPLLVSTGMADIREVAEALDVIAAAGDPPVGLFHCVSSYPAPPSDANLRAIPTLRAAFGRPTGWSDHSLGIELPVAAAALGAALLEKHLTLDRGRSGPDHGASLEPDEFQRMVVEVRSVESALGDGKKVPTLDELATAAVARRSLHWRRDLEAGSTVEPDDLVVLRPGTGMPPSAIGRVTGRRLTRAVRAGRAVEASDLDGLP